MSTREDTMRDELTPEELTPDDPRPDDPRPHDRGSRAGRRPSTTQDHIAGVALDLFAARGFDAVSVDDVALASGISRRTLFRYYPSKSAIPWGDFDSHLRGLESLLGGVASGVPMKTALRAALLAFNTFEGSELPRHRQRMRVILETAELQAYSMTMYAGWRRVIATFVATRMGANPKDLAPQSIAWLMLGVALSAYEHWLADENSELPDALGAAFDAVADGFE